MSLTDFLVHKAKCQRPSGTLDSYGQPIGTLTTIFEGQPCRITTVSAAENFYIAEPQTGLLSNKRRTVIFAGNVAGIMLQDILTLTLEDGSTDGPYQVSGIAIRRRTAGQKALIAVDVERTL